MIERIEEYEAADIAVALTPQGTGVLTLVTDHGRIVVHVRRSVLQRLARE